MTLRQSVDKIMDFAKEHEYDINFAYLRMAHLLTIGELKDITADELNNAHKFLKSHYDEAVLARKGKGLDKYIKALAEWNDEHHV